MRERIRRLEAKFAKRSEGVDLAILGPKDRERIADVLTPFLFEMACHKVLESPDPLAQKFLSSPGWEYVKELVKDCPEFWEKVQQCVLVLKAWRRWRETQYGPLAPKDWANWSWAVRDISTLRRDGTGGLPEAEALLEAADKAGVLSSEAD